MSRCRAQEQRPFRINHPTLTQLLPREMSTKALYADTFARFLDY
jgi:hypothetical protein